MKNEEAGAPEGGLSRRTVVQGAAWSLPVIAVAAATPIAAASLLCSASISTSTATYTRLSATSAVFTWVDLFEVGKDFTLTLSAVPNGAANMAINTTNNFVLDSSLVGGESVPSVRLSLDTLTLANIGGGERVTFSFAHDGIPATIADLTYKIKDMDGFQADDGLGGTERVYLSQGTGTVNSTWVVGAGTSGNPWRPSPTAPNVEVVPANSGGNINVTAPPLTAFDLTFIGNNSGRTEPDRPIQNLWVGPFNFTALNPACDA